MNPRLLLVLLAAVLPSVAFAAAPNPDATRQQLMSLAHRVTHFATKDIIANRLSERRWPAHLVVEQQELLAELRSWAGERTALAALVQDSDPKVRTLALGALFVREDPQDLPLIAPLTLDTAATFPQLNQPFDSRFGGLPLSKFESAQSVGDVAAAMLKYYLDAANIRSANVRPNGAVTGLGASNVRAKFDQYWAERGTRARNASWVLARMKRATRETLPFQPQYRSDIERVLAEIDALPPVERGWTLLYVHAGVFLDSESELVPAGTLVAALKPIGPDALLKFLQHQPVSDDPDLRMAAVDSSRAGQLSNGMQRFILAHATELLRATDADAVEAAADPDRTAWVAAAAELRGLGDIVKSAESLKAEIGRIPVRGYQGQGEQAELAATLWRMRGAAEKEYLANWFYAVLPVAQENMAHGPQSFLRSVRKVARPDISALLAAIVGDTRFSRADWPSLAELLMQVNALGGVPLVKEDAIYHHQPSSNRPDQREVLASWRNTLRSHFGLAPILPPVVTPPPQRILTEPAWAVPLDPGGESDVSTLAVSPDNRLLAIYARQSRAIVVRSVDTRQVLWQTTVPADSTWKHIVFSPGVPRQLLYFPNLGGESLVQEINVDDQTVAQRTIKGFDNLIDRRVVFDGSLSRFAFALGVHDLAAGKNLWRNEIDSPGDGAQMSLSADGKLFAVGGRNWPHRVRVFDANDGKPLRDFEEFSGEIAGLALTPDGRTLATASEGDGVRIWDVETGQMRFDVPWVVRDPLGARPSLVMSPDGRRVAVASKIIPLTDNRTHELRLGIVEVARGRLTSAIRVSDRDFWNLDLGALAFSPDGKWLYTAGRQLAAWSLE